jgi:hypothetical protein
VEEGDQGGAAAAMREMLAHGAEVLRAEAGKIASEGRSFPH